MSDTYQTPKPVEISCDVCYKMFLTIYPHHCTIDWIKKAYYTHRHSEECRGMTLPVSKIETEPF